MDTHAHASPIGSFVIHDAVERGTFSPLEATSVLWQTHKSLYLFAIMQKSIFKASAIFKSVHLANASHAEPKTRQAWQEIFIPEWTRSIRSIQWPAILVNALMESSPARRLHSAFSFVSWVPANIAFSPLCGALTSHPRLQCDSRFWQESKCAGEIKQLLSNEGCQAPCVNSGASLLSLRSCNPRLSHYCRAQGSELFSTSFLPELSLLSRLFHSFVQLIPHPLVQSSLNSPVFCIFIIFLKKKN